MKISNKISLFILFLLSVLAANTLVGLDQLATFNRDMRLVISQDLKLNESLMTVSRCQLERSMLFERILAIAEELAFVNISPAREQYLTGQIDTIYDNLMRLNQETAKSIEAATTVVDEGIKSTAIPERIKEFKYVAKILSSLEEQQKSYHMILTSAVSSIRGNALQDAITQLTNNRQDAAILHDSLEKFLMEIHAFSENSIDRAKYKEFIARNILWASFWFSLFIITLIAFAAIYAIITPLRDLSRAAKRVKQGDFDIDFKKFSKDEIGEVTDAFHAMAQQLVNFNAELQKKQNELSDHLDKTTRQNEELEKVNTELDAIIQTISHDIRSPLTALSGYADYIKQHYYEKLDTQGKRSVDGIINGVRHMNRLIEDLLALSRITRIENPYESTNLAEIVDNVRDQLRYEIERHRAELKIFQPLPTVNCDKIKIREAFLNLIENAIKFSSTGTQPPKIEIGFKEYPHYYEFYVKDNGIGIPEDYHEEIFKLFKRAHTIEQFEGTGAGLSIVKAIIEGHGGRIWVQSKAGFGAAFHFTLPKDGHQTSTS